MKGEKVGFTLIEILIVTSMIMLITLLGLVDFGGLRRRARDARRKSDLKQIQKALELYRARQSPPRYPGSLPVPGNCWTSAGDGTPCPPGGAPNIIYMEKMPGDPIKQPLASYSYSQVNTLNYLLCACLENASDPEGTSGSCGAAFSCSSGVKYELSTP